MTLAHALPVTGCRMLKAGCWLLVCGGSLRKEKWELFTLRSGNVWKPARGVDNGRPH